jgi:glyoxylase-like metal-dependent hydrolase (beta-lactamase superfamily II)
METGRCRVHGEGMIAQLDTVIPGLHASAPERLPFGRGLDIRAYLLEREAGNLLIYRSDTLPREAAAIRERGGIARQYLNHRHEAAPVCDWVTRTFDAPLFVHADDADAVSAVAHVRATFSRRHTLDDDFEAIPIPGHTPGATAFLWHSGSHRVLFTGDTIYFSRGRWVAAVLDSSDRERYLESLELLRDLDFDVIVPSIATAGETPYAFVEPGEAERRIDEIIERVRSGASG